jgi:hypothetical protein
VGPKGCSEAVAAKGLMRLHAVTEARVGTVIFRDPVDMVVLLEPHGTKGIALRPLNCFRDPVVVMRLLQQRDA